jgi:aarF domain-containing kinase
LNDNGKKKRKDKPMYGHYIGGLLGALFIGGLITSSDFRHSTIDLLLIVERVGVVTVAMTRCFKLYLVTLNWKYENEDEYLKELSKTHKKAAEITLHALRKNGGIYIKLGQHISAMTYLLPFEWTERMICLQSECPESTLEELIEMFESDTGKKFNEYFDEFDIKPIGVASLAQVHKAKLRENGQEVAVKLQHPSLSKFVPLDVALTKFVFDMMYKVFPDYPLTWLGEEMQESIFVELDFRYEAVNARKTKDYFQDYLKFTALKVPDVYISLPRLLIMEFIDGARLDDLKYIDEHKISRSEVCGCLAHIFNNMIFKSGFVHCDPHHGNIAIRYLETPKNGHNFEIILYDHGLYRTIPDQMKVDYAKFWLALIDKKQDEMKIYGKKFAKIDDTQFPIFAAAITGRDFEHALNGDLEDKRSETEISNMKEAMMNDGMVLNLMSLLATVPRIVLLILKTNDLVRHLDECLQNPLGQERTFVIMAKYCADTVYKDDLDKNSRYNTKWSIKWISGILEAFGQYYRRNFTLFFFDFVFYFVNIFR